MKRKNDDDDNDKRQRWLKRVNLIKTNDGLQAVMKANIRIECVSLSLNRTVPYKGLGSDIYY